MSSVTGIWGGAPLALIEQWGELEARPRVLLGEDRTLMWSNGSADAVIAQGVDIALDDRRFRLVNPAEAAAFENFLSKASAKVSAWCTPQADGDYLLFRAWRIEADGVVAIGVVFHAAGAKYVPNWADFSRVFGLTGAEHRIALRLLDGLKVEEVADDLSIAVGTARIHVRNLYGKLNVNSREAMFRLLAPFRVA